jgi:hypothetical protein
VTIPEYLKMIEYKKQCSCSRSNENGAIIAQTSEQNANLI